MCDNFIFNADRRMNFRTLLNKVLSYHNIRLGQTESILLQICSILESIRMKTLKQSWKVHFCSKSFLLFFCRFDKCQTRAKKKEIVWLKEVSALDINLFFFSWWNKRSKNENSFKFKLILICFNRLRRAAKIPCGITTSSNDQSCRFAFEGDIFILFSNAHATF